MDPLTTPSPLPESGLIGSFVLITTAVIVLVMLCVLGTVWFSWRDENEDESDNIEEDSVVVGIYPKLGRCEPVSKTPKQMAILFRA
jgi:hypothetical protein